MRPMSPLPKRSLALATAWDPRRDPSATGARSRTRHLKFRFGVKLAEHSPYGPVLLGLYFNVHG